MKTSKNIRILYKHIRDAKKTLRDNIKIGLVGDDEQKKHLKQIIGADPLNSIVEISDYSYVNDCDLVIIAVDSEKEALMIANSFKKPVIPNITIINRLADRDGSSLELLEKSLNLNNLHFTKEDDFSSKIRNNILNELQLKRLTLGRLLPDFRENIAASLINKTARQNLAIGAVFFFPGSDMPILTLNQMKMVVELAVIYNKEIGFARAKELMATLSGGYLFRGIARQFLGITGPAFLIKGAVAFSGTQILGRLAQKYFKNKGSRFEIKAGS